MSFSSDSCTLFCCHMVIFLNLTDTGMSAASMDITETFRPDDISKTDFFDFVTAPDSIEIGLNDRNATDASSITLDPPLQGYDQVRFGHKWK